MQRLIASDLACERGGRQVFAGLSFTVKAGEALVVTGRNGAGKSSLLRLVAGLVRIAGGTLQAEGGEADATVPEQAHYLGHLDAHKPALSVAENLAFWRDWLGGGGLALDDSLAAVDLAHLADLPAAYLSAGQRRRLSIARLLAARRPLWLLDEPTSALDAASQVRLAGLMEEHLAGGGLIMAATHMPLGLKAARELRIGDAA
jgi:heme exporter protein A